MFFVELMTTSSEANILKTAIRFIQLLALRKNPAAMQVKLGETEHEKAFRQLIDALKPGIEKG